MGFWEWWGCSSELRFPETRVVWERRMSVVRERRAVAVVRMVAVVLFGDVVSRDDFRSPGLEEYITLEYSALFDEKIVSRGEGRFW